MILHAGKVKVIFHEPIETKGMTLESISLLKRQVFSVIQSELSKS
jgi:1-acyl-sn-glycerol-3-phosphate acyltransferase